MLKTIFFDLDDTLLDFARTEAEALSQALRESDVEPTAALLERYHVINARQWELLEEGVLTREQVLLRRFELLFEEYGTDGDSREVCRRYETGLARGRWIIPGARELLETLMPRYDLYLVSNGTASVQHSRLENTGFHRYFRALFISQEVGYDKPRREFFDRCFAAIPDFRREEAVIVGDSLTSDIRGGINAGIRTCWYNPHGKTARPDIQPDFQFSRLEQLPALLEEIGKAP